MGRSDVRTYVRGISVATTLGIACQNTVAPIDVVGTYALSSTTGTIGRLETPVSGSLVLHLDGSALRRVGYYRDTTNVVTDVIELGTYHVTDSTIYLALRSDSGQSAFVWRVTATFASDGSIRLSYPRPADGTIVEIYQRPPCPVCAQATQ
ncbi:MAG TPA: hypothetical protein VKB45_16585 [Gemmatimonadales bacterium]|nr:hypothetical protein [Gemmatimonadales bacterium]